MNEREIAQSNLVPHYTKGGRWRSDFPIMESGAGCYAQDTDGNEYLDGLAGLFCTSLGHGRYDLAATAMKQMEQLGFFPNWGFASDRGSRCPRRPVRTVGPDFYVYPKSGWRVNIRSAD